MINSFIIDHCTTSNIITPEQAGGKKKELGMYRAATQILDEAKQHRCNFLMMWFNCKKAFEFVPHDWILKAFKPLLSSSTIENNQHDQIINRYMDQKVLS